MIDSSNFADSLAQSVASAISLAQIADKEREYLCQRAPNAIEWVSRTEFSNSPEFMGDGSPEMPPYWGSYQTLRDFFELRCPVCNTGSPSVWGKTKSQLEDEVLLVYSADLDDDACPKCHTTRSDFLEEGLFKGYHTFHLLCGMRCLTYDSLVYTDRGLLTLSELMPETQPIVGSPYPISSRVISKNDIATASDIAHAGVKIGVTIETSLGWTQTCAASHPVAVINPDLSISWREAGTLTDQDHLLLRVGAGLFGSVHLSQDDARVLGYLSANGWVNHPSRLKLTDDDLDLVEDFRSCVNRLGYGYGDISSYWVEDKHSQEVNRGCLEFRKHLEDLGLNYETSRSKQVPLSVRQGDQETVVEYLRAYLSSDGFCTLASNGNGGVSAEVGFDTASDQLASQVRLLLLNLGVVTNDHVRPVRKFSSSEVFEDRRTGHHVVVAVSCLKRFAEVVGLLGPRKQAALEECIKWVRSTDRKRTPGVPGSASLLRDYIRTIDLALGCKRVGEKGYKSVVISRIGDRYTEVNWCFKSKNQAATAQAIRIVLEATHDLGPKHARDLYERLTFISSGEWLPLPVRKVSDAGTLSMADLCVPGPECYVANGFLNHNSGKSQTAAFLGNYVEHVLLTIAHKDADHKGLQRYLGGLISDQYDLAFVASSLRTGEESIWTKYRKTRANSLWFQRYTPWLKTQERLQETPDGLEKWSYSEAHSKIKNDAAGLVISAFSANSDTLIGRTRILAAADEVGRMKNTDSALGADEIYRGLENSLKTVRSAVINRSLPLRWLGLMASVSSPTSHEDKAMRLLKDAENAPRMYAKHATTWGFNPYQPRANFVEDFLKDPIGAERDFGANPPMAANPLILDVPAFEESAVSWESVPSATFLQYEFNDDTGRNYLGIRLENAQLNYRETPRYIAFDPGRTFDAFAGACAHAEFDEDGRLITVFDWVVRLLPRQGQEVWFDGVFDIVRDLQKYQHIQRVEFDHWHSSQIIQNIRNKLGLVSEPNETKDKHFMQFVRDAMSGRVKMLPPLEDDYDIRPPQHMSPEAVALYELERLEVDPMGKVTNPRKGEVRGAMSDDVARVIVHAHRMVQDIGYTERYDDRSIRAKRLRSEASLQSHEMRSGGMLFRPTSRSARSRGW